MRLKAKRGVVTRYPYDHEKVRARGKIVPQRFTLQEIEDADARCIGFCVACGAEVECCEPDARARPCDACGLRLGYGAQEIGLRGWLADDDGNPLPSVF